MLAYWPVLACYRYIDVSVCVFWCEEVGWEVKKKIYTHSVIFSTTTNIYEVHHWVVDHSQLACTVVATFFAAVLTDRNFGRLSPAWGFAEQAINGVRFGRAGRWNEKGRARGFCKPGNADLSFMFVFAEWFVFRFLACDLSVFFPSIPTTSLIKLAIKNSFRSVCRNFCYGTEPSTAATYTLPNGTSRERGTADKRWR